MVRNSPRVVLLSMIGDMGTQWLCEHGAWVAVCGALVIGGLFVLWQRRGFQKRRTGLQKREILDANEWFRRFYPDARNKPATHAVLEVLAKELDIHWTQLRPEDSFERDIRIQPKYSPYDDLEETECFLISVMREHGVPRQEWPPMTGDLKSLLDRVAALCQQGGEAVSE